jgi:hypothetical protein
VHPPVVPDPPVSPPTRCSVDPSSVAEGRLLVSGSGVVSWYVPEDVSKIHTSLWMWKYGYTENGTPTVPKATSPAAWPGAGGDSMQS